MATRKLRNSLLALGLALSMLTPSIPQASVLDTVFFQILGLVIVWGADGAAPGGSAPIVSDFVLMTTGSGAAGADITAGDVYPVLTGSLNPIPAASSGGELVNITGAVSGGVFTDDGDGFLDSGDTLTAFGIDNATGVDLAAAATAQHSFYVASNTAFDVQASVAAPVGTLGVALADVGYQLSLTQAGTDGAITFGASARAPAAIGTSNYTGGDTLADVSASPEVFTGLASTAASAGSIADQSVRFDAAYDLSAYDLSMGAGDIQIDVTYTIYVP